MKIVKELLPYLYHKGRLSIPSSEKLNTPYPAIQIPVVVSLTTIISRIETVHLAIRSVLVQQNTPEKVVLWLHEDLKNKVPQHLLNLQGDIFQIQYSTYDCPHLKLIESLKKFPQKIIITIDDDQIYPKEFLKLLYQEHLQHPEAIISNISRKITFSTEKELLPYEQWPYVLTQPTENKFLLPLGVFGVLYPPGSLDASTTNMDLIAQLTPKADDLWFKAMSLLKETEVQITTQKPKDATLILGTQKIALKRFNIREDYNRLQWKKLMEYFKFTV